VRSKFLVTVCGQQQVAAGVVRAESGFGVRQTFCATTFSVSHSAMNSQVLPVLH
jgi:hypothetical protein